jgi:hypothetical protein
MKYKIILLFFLTSCINNTYVDKNKFSYSSKGFAKIKKNITVSLDQDYYASHNKLKLGTKIKLINPVNKKSLEVVVKKKSKYNNFYKILISENIAKELNLDLSFPYIEINEIKTNKSFVAKKAITETVEKRIANKAPIYKINIDNLKKNKKIKIKKPNNYSILVAEFYNLESAELLKKRLTLILLNSNYQLIYINKKNNKSYELLLGPYNTIKKLKNDYIVLDESNFEDLDIIINE